MRRSAARVATSLIHLCLDPWIGLVEILILTIGLALSVALAITVVGGAFFAAVTLGLMLLLGRMERARANVLLDARIPPLPPDRRSHRFGFIGRLLTSGQAWRAAAYVAVHAIVSPVLFAVTVAFWSGGLVGLAMPFYRSFLPRDTARLLLTDVDTGAKALLVALAGAVVLVAAPFVTLAAAHVDRLLARGLLGANQTEALKAEVKEVSARRTAAVDAAEAERRRIERDLHDGAQQRLVSLGMTLGLAREKMDQDPERARALMDEAHTEAKAAMTELRAIARGIHPAVLDDRGLDAALSALAARSPVPVTVTVDLPGRMGMSTEGAAYYVVAEALTNAAKHAGATRATVDVSLRHGHVMVRVGDDGQGGASIQPDGGLAGLQSRLAGLGGTLRLDSPPGGPTVLTAELPRET